MAAEQADPEPSRRVAIPRSHIRATGPIRVSMTGHRSRALLSTVGIPLITWICVVVALWPAHGKALDWDEVDYANAAKLGIVANAFEVGGLPPADFIRFGWAKVTGRDAPLPQGYDEATDPLLLRHLHPPFVTYLVAAVAGDQMPIDERRVRLVQLIGALALIAVLAMAYRSLSRPNISGAVMLALLSGWTCLELFSGLSFHGWFAVWALPSVMLLARWLRSGGWRIAVVLGTLLGLSMLTLESAVVLWLVAGLAYLARRKLVGAGAATWRELLLVFAVAVAVVVVVWPGSILSMSIARSPAQTLYRIRLGQEYASVGSHAGALAAALLPVLVLAPISAVVLWRTRGEGNDWRVYAIVTAVYTAALARFAIATRYLEPPAAVSLPFIALAATRVGRPAAAFFVALAVITMGATLPAWWQDETDPARADIDWLRGELVGRPALVDGAHVVRYYVGPGYDLQPLTRSYEPVGLLVRRNGRYEEAHRPDVRGRIVVLKVRAVDETPLEQGVLAGCERTERPTLLVYDCTAL